ncbi:RNA polymerase sigma factor [Psychroserpens luteolus]|uniref:RNA polymerase sigma factor n=1 Tax=Psychroserpens luteolus TaxID=2855840 RepID=UPI001E2D03D9|nr:RNA polymerase sigma factor [Psychroserpens luteolus]MCD2258202.1 RNA polymerase sigma factor [Psychroserpens luteolus]
MKSLEKQFKEVYEANYAKVNRLCLGYTNGDAMLSKDLTQDVFIKVWQHLDSFRNESNITTWIYRIAVNTCLLELRKKKPVRLSNHLNHIEASTENQNNDKELEFNKLYHCIGRLKPENKSIILLELEGVPQKEIAEITGLSHETIRVRIYRIKKELTKCVRK